MKDLIVLPKEEATPANLVRIEDAIATETDRSEKLTIANTLEYCTTIKKTKEMYASLVEGSGSMR